MSRPAKYTKPGAGSPRRNSLTGPQQGENARNPSYDLRVVPQTDADLDALFLSIIDDKPTDLEDLRAMISDMKRPYYSLWPKNAQHITAAHVELLLSAGVTHERFPLFHGLMARKMLQCDNLGLSERLLDGLDVEDLLPSAKSVAALELLVSKGLSNLVIPDELIMSRNWEHIAILAPFANNPLLRNQVRQISVDELAELQDRKILEPILQAVTARDVFLETDFDCADDSSEDSLKLEERFNAEGLQGHPLWPKVAQNLPWMEVWISLGLADSACFELCLGALADDSPIKRLLIESKDKQ